MSNQNINIRRPYFKKDKYGRIIDNSFQQPGDVFVTSSIGDFYSNYLSLLLSMTPEQHALFYNGSLPYSKFDTTNLSSSEIERLKALISESRENKVLKNNNTPQENPIVPNGSFYRRGEALINKDKVSLAGGIFFYIQDGKARLCENPNVFLNLFTSITNLNPYKKEVLKDNVPVIGAGGLPEGKIITLADLGAENYNNIEEEPTSTQNIWGFELSSCQKYSVGAFGSSFGGPFYTISYKDCNDTPQQITVTLEGGPKIIYARPDSIVVIEGGGATIPLPNDGGKDEGNNGGQGPDLTNLGIFATSPTQEGACAAFLGGINLFSLDYDNIEQAYVKNGLVYTDSEGKNLASEGWYKLTSNIVDIVYYVDNMGRVSSSANCLGNDNDGDNEGNTGNGDTGGNTGNINNKGTETWAPGLGPPGLELPNEPD
jgi:hypothetical protein